MNPRPALALTIVLAAARCVVAGPAADAPPATRPLPTLATPAVSPDGREIAFVNADAVWTVPAAGGDARVLVGGLPEAARPLYSPDGTKLAVVSTRNGRSGIYVADLTDASLTRLTYDETPPRLEAWSPDGRSVLFSTSAHQAGGATDVYRVPAGGGTPVPVIAAFYDGAYDAQPSPDGKTIAFCGGGLAGSQWWRHGHAHIDCESVWLTPAGPDAGKVCVRLTSDTEKNVWPMWAGGGKSVVFVSDKGGTENLWAADTLAVPTTRPTTRPTTAPAFPPARQLTHFAGGRLLWPGLSADGHTLAFERDGGLWTIDLNGGEPHPLTVRLRGAVAGPELQHTVATKDASDLAVSPDGRKVALVVRGQIFAAAANGGRTADGSAVRVTHTDAVEAGPAWAHDNRRLVYTSTRDGPRHLYLYDFAAGTETRLTDTPGNDSRPLFSPDDAQLAFVRDGVELRALRLRPTLRQRVAALAAKFAAPSPAASQPATQPATTEPATSRPATPATASTRPAERLLATHVLLGRPPLDDDGAIAWSPAGDYLAYATPGPTGFRNVHLVPAAGGPERQISFLANAGGGTIAWAPDGSAVYFNSGQRTEDYTAARVDLVPRTPTFRTNQFRDLFRQRPDRPTEPPTPQQTPTGDTAVVAMGADADAVPATDPAPPSRVAVPATRPARTDVAFDGIDQRLNLLPVGLDVHDLAVSPDGKTLGLIAASGGHENVYAYPVDPLAEKPVARQLTSTAGGKSRLQFVGDRLYFLEDGRVMSVATGGDPTPDAPPAGPRNASGPTGAAATPGVARESPMALELDVDFRRDRAVVFDQAWRALDENFHDPHFNGVDWDAARAAALPKVLGAKNPGELRRAMLLMIGELNASHSGVSAPPDAGNGTADAQPIGVLGVDFDAAAYDATGRPTIAAVLPFGPADLAKLKPGTVVRAVDGQSADRPANLDQLLDGKAGREVVLTVEDAAGRRDVRLKPAGGATERTLRYRAWVEANRQYVLARSGGRLGYVHLSDMSKQALARLANDLDERNFGRAGVVVDVRNNSGGFVNGYAIDVLARRNYVSLVTRGGPVVAGRAQLGQRYLGLPTALVTNRMTLSDGEDFTEGYRANRLGPVVGEPTAGWIIFTRGTTLLDGTRLRLPSETVLDAQGRPLEMHLRPVDVPAARPFGESAPGRDTQLDAAVAALLGGRR